MAGFEKTTKNDLPVLLGSSQDSESRNAEACWADLPAQPSLKKSFLRRSSGRGMAGVQTTSSQKASSRGGLLNFLKGSGVDCKGRRLDDILEWDFSRLERCHDYIQWLFPTTE